LPGGINVVRKISYHATISHHVKRGRTEETMARRMILAVLLMTPVSVFAQGLGRIAGTVVDPSGALVPGVKITATEVGTKLSRSALSDEHGLFVIPSLRPATMSWQSCQVSATLRNGE